MTSVIRQLIAASERYILGGTLFVARTTQQRTLFKDDKRSSRVDEQHRAVIG